MRPQQIFSSPGLYRVPPTRGPPGYIKRSAATFVNDVNITKFSRLIRQLCIPLTVIFPLEAREPAHNNKCSPLP